MLIWVQKWRRNHRVTVRSPYGYRTVAKGCVRYNEIVRTPCGHRMNIAQALKYCGDPGSDVANAHAQTFLFLLKRKCHARIELKTHKSYYTFETSS